MILMTREVIFCGSDYCVDVEESPILSVTIRSKFDLTGVKGLRIEDISKDRIAKKLEELRELIDEVIEYLTR